MWRVLEIHKFVQTGRHPNCSTLAAEIEVTPKTIQRDITFMRDQLGLLWFGQSAFEKRAE